MTENSSVLTRAPVAVAEMLIRRPVAAVFEAFMDPAITSRFWFSRGTGRLEVGKAVEWHWEMYGFHLLATARAIEPERRILIDWGGPDEPPTAVEWTFTARPDNTTFVSVSH